MGGELDKWNADNEICNTYTGWCDSVTICESESTANCKRRYLL